MSKKLTEKQKKFCREYMIDFNAKQAAIRAGYSKKTAHVIASENLQRTEVQQFIAALQEKQAAKFEVTLDQVIRQYHRLAFQDIRKYYNEDGSLKPMHQLDDDAAAALAGVDVDEIWEGKGEERIKIGETKKIKRWDAVRALEGLCRVLGYEAPKKMDLTSKGKELNQQPIMFLSAEKLTDAQIEAYMKNKNDRPNDESI